MATFLTKLFYGHFLVLLLFSYFLDYITLLGHGRVFCLYYPSWLLFLIPFNICMWLLYRQYSFVVTFLNILLYGLLSWHFSVCFTSRLYYSMGTFLTKLLYGYFLSQITLCPLSRTHYSMVNSWQNYSVANSWQCSSMVTFLTLLLCGYFLDQSKLVMRGSNYFVYFAPF